MTDPNAYKKAYRRQRPTRERLGRKARQQALSELLLRYEAEFRALVDQKRAALGLPPARPGRPNKPDGGFI